MLPTAPNALDLQGFERLRARAAENDPAALGEAAVQFEALVIGMMLETARSASFGEGLFDGGNTERYLELMDRQVALELARAGGFGFAKMIMRQLGAEAPPAPASPFVPSSPHAARSPYAPASPFAAPSHAARPAQPSVGAASSRDLPLPAATAHSPAPAFDTPEQFVASLLPDAAAAGRVLGVDPRVLIAQAALETGWGKAIPTHADGSPAHNLFGIKAGASWDGPRVARWTIEHVDGVAERKREQFRAYPDSASSFADYVRLIAGNPRYSPARAARDAESYARAVADAGYATDPAYADKWLAVYRSEPLAALELKPPAGRPTQ